MLTACTVREYAARLASGDPTPGGGSAAAHVGALAVALGEMAGNFTVGKQKYIAVEADIKRILISLETQRNCLLDLTDADAAAYAKVGAAYSLPRATDEEKTARKVAIEEALKSAAEVPLAITVACLSTISVLDELRQKSNPNLLSDVACAAELALASLRCAWLNVEVNLAAMSDEEYITATRHTIDMRLQEAESHARFVFKAIAQDIRAGRVG